MFAVLRKEQKALHTWVYLKLIYNGRAVFWSINDQNVPLYNMGWDRHEIESMSYKSCSYWVFSPEYSNHGLMDKVLRNSTWVTHNLTQFIMED